MSHLLLLALAVWLGATLWFTTTLTLVNLVDRGARPRLSRAAVARLFREWAAHAALPLLLAPGLRREGPVRLVGPPRGRVPVLLAHGYTMNWSPFSLLAAWLRRRGWQAVWAVNHRPAGAPIPAMAHALGQRVDELRAATGAAQVDIVAHSMGGVIAGWYVNHLDGAPKVRRIVTLGTPWAGTRTHVLTIGREARDLDPAGPVIAGLRPPKVPVTSIWSPQDQIICPSASCALPEGQSICVPDVGHVEMLLHPQIWRLVGAALAAPEPPAPGAPTPAWPPA